MVEDFEICHYRIKLTESDEILDCTMYTHIGRHHSTATHEFWRARDARGEAVAGMFIVRDFQTGYRLTKEAEEIRS